MGLLVNWSGAGLSPSAMMMMMMKIVAIIMIIIIISKIK